MKRKGNVKGKKKRLNAEGRVELAENRHTHTDYHNKMDEKMLSVALARLAAHTHTHTHRLWGTMKRLVFQVKLVFDFLSRYESIFGLGAGY